MAIGGPIKKIVPVFETINEAYQTYDGVEVGAFSLDPEPFINDYYDSEEGTIIEFDPETYYDLVLAPAYVIKEVAKRTSGFNKVLSEVFFKMYPDPEGYRTVLNTSITLAERELQYVANEWNRKTEIQLHYTSLKKRFEQGVSLLKTVPAGTSKYKYAQISQYYCNQILCLIEDIGKNVALKPASIILYDYYLKRPSVSWIENPLAFFTHSLEHGRLKASDQHISVKEVTNIKPQYNASFNREANISISRIEEKINSLKSKERKQEYIDEISTALNILFLKTSPEYRWIYEFIGRRLTDRFKSYSFNLSFNYVVEPPFELVETATFLNRLLNPNLVLIDHEGRKLKLFENKVNKRTLSSFIEGDLNSVEEIRFNWPPETVHYLLMKLLANGAKFSIADLAAFPPKIYLPDKNTGKTVPFTRGKYDTYKSDYNKGEKPNTFGAAIIDGLFC